MKLNIEYLEVLRKAYNENIREFAKRIGVSHQTYYNFQKGNGQPTLETIGHIAKNLKLIDGRELIS